MRLENHLEYYLKYTWEGIYRKKQSWNLLLGTKQNWDADIDEALAKESPRTLAPIWLLGLSESSSTKEKKNP